MGPTGLLTSTKLGMPVKVERGSETVGDKLHCREGNSPDHQLRPLSVCSVGRMFSCEDNQEVGLEAAILERVRNSSLVKRLSAENVAGLSTPPKMWQHHGRRNGVVLGRGASSRW